MQDLDFTDSDIFYGIAVNAGNSVMNVEDIESSIHNGSAPSNGPFNTLYETIGLAICVIARMFRFA